MSGEPDEMLEGMSEGPQNQICSVLLVLLYCAGTPPWASHLDTGVVKVRSVNTSASSVECRSEAGRVGVLVRATWLIRALGREGVA